MGDYDTLEKCWRRVCKRHHFHPCMQELSDAARCGTVLVIVALLLVAIFGLAALVIDLGLARLTQRQMQVAADGAALEGLRYRDFAPESTEANAAQRNMLRRLRVARRIGEHFDDDLSFTAGDVMQMGAGPILHFSGGVAMPGEEPWYAGQTMSVPATAESRVLKPQDTLQLNHDNLEAGDIVFGDANAMVNPEATTPYSHADFDPRPSGDAVLVRLRRTNGFASDIDGHDNIDGASSSGPALPYLFARGVLLSGETRGRGIPVRATAIAGSVRTKSVGPVILSQQTSESGHVHGSAPISLKLDYWNSVYWQTNDADTLTLDGPNLRAASVSQGVVGFAATGSAMGSIFSLGQLSPQANDAASLHAAASYSEYAVYAPIVNQDAIIVGFGYVRWSLAEEGAAITLRRMRTGDSPCHLAAGNATGTLIYPFSAEIDAQQIMQQHVGVSQPLCSPALIR